MRAVSRELHDDILVQIDNGESDRQIARKKPVGRTTVQRIRREFRPYAIRPKTGRSPTLTERERRFLVRAVTVDGLETAVQANVLLRAELGIVISDAGVRRALRMEGLEAAVKEKKPKLSPKNVALRLEFARKYKDWTVADWMRVLWSDETKILRFNSDGRSWCWVRDVEAREPRTVQQTVKHGRGSIMIWGCMTAHGVGFMCKIDGKMNKEDYLEILKDDLQQTFDYYELDRETHYFQQENDSKHSSKLVQEWLDEQEFEVLDWPPQSPLGVDENPP
jgi:transposase